MAYWARARVQGCEHESSWLKFLCPHHPRVLKYFFSKFPFFKQQVGLLIVPTTLAAPFLFFLAKPSFVGPHYIPKFRGKKPKATPKVTLTSHQKSQMKLLPIFGGLLSIPPTTPGRVSCTVLYLFQGQDQVVLFNRQ